MDILHCWERGVRLQAFSAIWTGLMWRRMGTSDGLLWVWGFIKCREIFDQLNNHPFFEKDSAALS
jgi:hypothetical protein